MKHSNYIAIASSYLQNIFYANIDYLQFSFFSNRFPNAVSTVHKKNYSKSCKQLSNNTRVLLLRFYSNTVRFFIILERVLGFEVLDDYLWVHVSDKISANSIVLCVVDSIDLNSENVWYLSEKHYACGVGKCTKQVLAFIEASAFRI